MAYISLNYLHVPCFSGLYGCVNETFPASHCVEEKLSWSQTGIKAISHKAFGSWELKRGGGGLGREKKNQTKKPTRSTILKPIQITKCPTFRL